jgi:LAO/AO transport system kinase
MESMLELETGSLVNRMFQGDKPSLARLISLIEKESPEVPEIKETVYLIAMDPSILITVGAIVGDRTCQKQHYLGEGVFIRRMVTRGCYGGLCQAVDNTLKLIEASGKDIIFIESARVRQTEIK